MTVMSRPVLGGQFGQQTVTPSAAASIQLGTSLQHVAGTSVTCTGLSPSRWCSQTSSWPSPYCATSTSGRTSTWGQTGYSSTSTTTATHFHSQTTGFQGTVFGSHTMLDVMKQRAGGAGYSTLGMYCAAALLNAAAGRTPVLSQAAVQKMWNDFLLFGYYEPMPGIRWSSTQIVTYIKSTMI